MGDMLTQEIEIKATPKQCYDVVWDFEKYPDFLKDVKSVDVDAKKAKTCQVTYHVEVIKKIAYTIDLIGTPHTKIEWTFVKGDIMKDNRGSWEFEEIKKGLTKAIYKIDVKFPIFVPSSVTKALVGKNLPAMLENFKKRIESLK